MQKQGQLPDVITYNAIISACEKGKKPERALELSEAVQQQGLLPNVSRTAHLSVPTFYNC